MLVLQFEVVPVLAADEGTALAVLQFEVMQTLEDLREGLALLEVQATVVDGSGTRFTTLAHHVVRRNVIRVGTTHGPTGAERQRRVEAALDLPDIELHGVSRCGQAKRDCGAQQMWLESCAHCCSCHANSRFCESTV
ncbi:hypothetical protein D9M71_716920 [compost metagenome]